MSDQHAWRREQLPAPAALTTATILITAAELLIDIVNAFLRILFDLGLRT